MMETILGWGLALAATVIIARLFWKAAEFRYFREAIVLTGVVGVVSFVAGAFVPGAPTWVLGAGFVLLIVTSYGWLFLRHRHRVSDPLDVLEISYGKHLTRFERTTLGFFAVFAAWAVMTTDVPSFARIGGLGIALWLTYCTLTGRPPVPPQSSSSKGPDGSDDRAG